MLPNKPSLISVLELPAAVDLRFLTQQQCTPPLFFENFEPFRAIVRLDGAAAINTLLTYLHRKSLNTLAAQNIVTTTHWETFRKNAIEALSSPREAVKARYELKKAKQRADETVAQFGERLIELAKLSYKANEQEAMESIIKDALSGGVIRDEIAITLINMSLTVPTELDPLSRTRITSM